MTTTTTTTFRHTSSPAATATCRCGQPIALADRTADWAHVNGSGFCASVTFSGNADTHASPLPGTCDPKAMA